MEREEMGKLMGDSGEEEKSKLYRQLRKYISICVGVALVTLFVLVMAHNIYLSDTTKPAQSKDALQAQVLKDFMEGKPIPTSQAWWVYKRNELNFDPALQNLCRKNGIDYESAYDVIVKSENTYLVYAPKKAEVSPFVNGEVPLSDSEKKQIEGYKAQHNKP